MSDKPEATTEKRRRFRRRGPPREKSAEGAAPKAAEERKPREPRERKPREPRVVVPVPEELFGKTTTGKIVDIITERGKFGFISIGEGEALPRIYFNVTNFDEELPPRKGYSVEFVPSKDETGRAYAANVKLTAEGRVAAAEREASIAKSNEAKAASKAAAPAAAAASAEEGAKRVRAPRKRPVDERSVDLTVTCDGKTETHTVVAKLAQSIGKLKHSAVSAFEAPVTYKIYCNGELLTKAILRGLADGAAVQLREPAAGEA